MIKNESTDIARYSYVIFEVISLHHTLNESFVPFPMQMLSILSSVDQTTLQKTSRKNAASNNPQV